MLNILIDYHQDILSGLKVTLLASLTALVGSMIIGTLMALLQGAKRHWIRRIGNTYVNFFRNVPLLIIVMFFFVVLPLYGFKMNGILSGTIGLTLYTSSFIADTVRAGIEAVPKGQTEAGVSQGLTHFQIMFYIVLPQAFKLALPSLGNQFINLVKNSSILAMVAGADLMYQGDIIASTTFNTIGTYTLIGLIYLAMTLPLSYVMRYVEKKLAVS